MSSFLMEIGTEELPAIPLLKELPNIKNKFKQILKSHRLDCEVEFFYTPRRLVLISDNFPTSQKEEILEFFGPPIDIAYKDGNPTQAALGFFKKCGISENETQITTKDNKEVLYCKKEAISKNSNELIQEILKEFLDSLNFGKAMRWGSNTESFIRPIKWILCMIDNKLVPLEIFGIKSSQVTYVHRNISYESKHVSSIDSYLQTLQNGKVILNQQKREEKILNEIAIIEKENNIKVEIDKELLDEIVSITEYPTALFGNFSEHFLEIPAPCIITSMKVNQRYFATYKDLKLYNGFVMVQNSLSENPKTIIEGNLKVLHARLEDALFFYHNDLKAGLDENKLVNITFVENLGSMLDKTKREVEIAKILCDIFKEELLKESNDFGLIQELIIQATTLSKTDLTSEMVYEFTELQGIMGYYYAKELRYDDRVALAIKEQYLPNSEDSELPSNLISAIIALSHKLDNLFGLFSINKIPSGSKDPFALRRAANGVIKIIIHFNLNFKLKEVFNNLRYLYKNFELKMLEEFILERLESTLPYNPSIIRAILASNEDDLLNIYLKAEALESSLQSQDKTMLMQTFKRLANIIKDVNFDNLNIQEDKLIATEEIELYNEFVKYKNKTFDNSDFKGRIDYLLSLNQVLSRFFDKVLVNAPDETLKTNRKNLIAQIYMAFFNIADIKEITL
ncbi:glycine--tRNA ligase subunit beta [Helicobacter sp. WB40]|uniref:glycine--tRNA ligase subunit beta n=1 Tax=Helicobacter sp. WB40 TaxID=3004130 RepID=UPI0022EBEAF1|nr:glycine--tRNA ligase subunit beta [Helicobacter sp. WB40]MDA3966750.1 glycine--tRNA ligase subunit beta [Helicobacter sp. WB40]